MTNDQRHWLSFGFGRMIAWAIEWMVSSSEAFGSGWAQVIDEIDKRADKPKEVSGE